MTQHAGLQPHERRNRDMWNSQVEEYEDLHAADLSGERAMAWGLQIPYGEWIRLFRAADLTVEDLIETRPAEGQTSTYRSAEENEWARHWPMENIWRLRKLSQSMG